MLKDNSILQNKAKLVQVAMNIVESRHKNQNKVVYFVHLYPNKIPLRKVNML